MGTSRSATFAATTGIGRAEALADAAGAPGAELERRSRVTSSSAISKTAIRTSHIGQRRFSDARTGMGAAKASSSDIARPGASSVPARAVVKTRANPGFFRSPERPRNEHLSAFHTTVVGSAKE